MQNESGAPVGVEEGGREQGASAMLRGMRAQNLLTHIGQTNAAIGLAHWGATHATSAAARGVCEDRLAVLRVSLARASRELGELVTVEMAGTEQEAFFRIHAELLAYVDDLRVFGSVHPPAAPAAEVA